MRLTAHSVVTSRSHSFGGPSCVYYGCRGRTVSLISHPWATFPKSTLDITLKRGGEQKSGRRDGRTGTLAAARMRAVAAAKLAAKLTAARNE